MAEYLTMKSCYPLSRRLASSLTDKALLMLLISCAGLVVTDAAQAEPLHDPTQAPAALYADDNAAEVTGPVLQSVMIGPHYRAAIISGEKVMLGKKYAQATLIKLNEHEAVLRHADLSTQTLVLHPITVKKVITSTASPAVTNKSLPSKPIAKSTN